MTESTLKLRDEAFPLAEFLSRRPFDESVDITETMYNQIVDDMAKLLVEEFPSQIVPIIMTLHSFFRVTSNEGIPFRIKSNAVLCAAALLSHCTDGMRDNPSLNTALLIHSMLTLVEDPEPTVRKKVVEALGLLHSY